MKQMTETVSDLLHALGITANYKGFHYSVLAVELASSDPTLLLLVTKALYPRVAARFATTASRVERNIRHTVDLAWRTNPQLLQDLAGYALPRRPCASQFIAILAEICKKELTTQEPDGQLRMNLSAAQEHYGSIW